MRISLPLSHGHGSVNASERALFGLFHHLQRDVDLQEDLFDDTLAHCGAARIAPQGEGRLHGGHDSMAQHFRCEELDVVRQSIRAGIQKRIRLYRAIQRLRAPRANPERKTFVRARALNQDKHVIHDRFIHGYLFTAH